MALLAAPVKGVVVAVVLAEVVPTAALVVVAEVTGTTGAAGVVLLE
jgi:hypothetical protein